MPQLKFQPKKVFNNNTIVPTIANSHINIAGCDPIPYRQIVSVKKEADVVGVAQRWAVSMLSTIVTGAEYVMTLLGGTRSQRTYRFVALPGWTAVDLITRFTRWSNFNHTGRFSWHVS